MKVDVTRRHIIRLTAPLSLALLVPQLSFFTNTAFLGRLGEQELAVNGVSGIFYLILTMVGYGLANGIQVMLARRAGEGNHEAMTRLFANGLLLTLLAAALLMLLSACLAPLIFRYSLSEPGHAVLAGKFLLARMWGLPFLMLTQLVNALCITNSRSRLLIWGSVTVTIFNILFDYLLIFGHGGMPALGLQGAAAASVIAEAGACGVMYAIAQGRGIFRQHPVRKFLKPDAVLMRAMLVVSAPLIVQYFFSIGGWQVFFIYVERLGQKELAASQILRSVFGIIGICTWAFATTTNMMVSNLIGQGRQELVIPLVKKVAGMSLGTTAVISTLLLLGGRLFLSFYRDDPALVELALPSLRVIVIAALIMSISTVVFNGVVGTGKTAVNLAIEITCVGTYLVYCTIVIERLRAGLAWAWVSEFVYWTTLLAAAGLYLRSGRWKKALKG